MIYLLPQPSFFKELQFCTFALIKYKNADFYGLQSISPGHGIEQKGDLLKRDWRFAVDSGRVILMDSTACSCMQPQAVTCGCSIYFFPDKFSTPYVVKSLQDGQISLYFELADVDPETIPLHLLVFNKLLEDVISQGFPNQFAFGHQREGFMQAPR